MFIGFIGDVHGRVFQAIVALATWQERLGKSFDVLIQVGDLGAFPDPTDLDPATNRYLAADPSEADFSRLLQATDEHAHALRLLREQFVSPIYFIRGNHEDFDWLRQLPVDGEDGTAGVDPFGLFRYVPDATVLRFGELRVGFLGGVEERSDAASIDYHRYELLMDLGPNVLDVLVTHEGPYGSSRGYRGDIHGSKIISDLIHRTQPRFHIAGHAHCISGPERYGSTIYLGLDCLIASPIWEPEAVGLQPGCFASLDTELNDLRPIKEPWLSGFPKLFDFDRWIKTPGI